MEVGLATLSQFLSPGEGKGRLLCGLENPRRKPGRCATLSVSWRRVYRRVIQNPECIIVMRLQPLHDALGSLYRLVTSLVV